MTYLLNSLKAHDSSIQFCKFCYNEMKHIRHNWLLFYSFQTRPLQQDKEYRPCLIDSLKLPTKVLAFISSLTIGNG